MKNIIILTILTIISISGCTQIVTAPIGIATSAVTGTIDIAGSAVGAVAGD